MQPSQFFSDGLNDGLSDGHFGSFRVISAIQAFRRQHGEPFLTHYSTFSSGPLPA